MKTHLFTVVISQTSGIQMFLHSHDKFVSSFSPTLTLEFEIYTSFLFLAASYLLSVPSYWIVDPFTVKV